MSETPGQTSAEVPPEGDHKTRFSRRKFVAMAAAAPVAGTVAAVVSSQLRAGALATAADAFSPAVTFRTTDGWYGAPIHAAVRPDGSVFMMGYARASLDVTDTTPTRPCSWLFPASVSYPLPSVMTVTAIPEPLDYYETTVGSDTVSDNLFCSGHTHTADGLFFCVGGSRTTYAPPSTSPTVVGLPYGAIFDGTTFARVTADMGADGPTGLPYRWYPTVTRMTDGKLLVTGGFDAMIPTSSINRSVELFDPTAGTWSTVSSNPAMPADILASDYTHVILLPYQDTNDVLLFGEPQIPTFMSVAGTPKWTTLDSNPRPNTAAWQAQRLKQGSWSPLTAPGAGSSTVMLPYRVNEDWGYRNGTVVIANGPPNSPWTANVDTFDPRTSTWGPTITALVQRSNADLVLLPDGHLLRINGHSSDTNIGRAELFDIKNGLAPAIGTSDSGQMRGYHNIAVLMPDGSVLVGGGRGLVTDTTFEKPTWQFYYPPYVFKTGRPSILSAPKTITLGAPFTMAYSGATPPADMVLIGLPAMTHQFDQNQRAIQVPVMHTTSAGGSNYTIGAVGPASSRICPPGYYMLFVIDGNRLPSKAAIVRVVAPAAAAAAGVGAGVGVGARDEAGMPAWVTTSSKGRLRREDPLAFPPALPKPRVGPRQADMGGYKPGDGGEDCG